MGTQIKELKAKLFDCKYRLLMNYGLKHGYFRHYDDELIEKLRNIYFGGMPASILLLYIKWCNGKCYDSAILMARAFLDTDDDVNVICGSVDSIKYNKRYIDDNEPINADHCFVERITKDGKKLIYDTTSGGVFDEWFYKLVENPKIRHTRKKEETIDYVNSEEPEDLEKEKYTSLIFIPFIEAYCASEKGRINEVYSSPNGGLLEREIAYYKNLIDYDRLQRETQEAIEKENFPEFIKY